VWGVGDGAPSRTFRDQVDTTADLALGTVTSISSGWALEGVAFRGTPVSIRAHRRICARAASDAASNTAQRPATTAVDQQHDHDLQL
jgi:hypothetical protein